jgi:hypothetical protein
VSADPIDIALRVAAALEAVGVDYLVGGSLSSSFFGEPRATLDIDLVVRLTEQRIPELLSSLGDEFMADPKAIARAVRENSGTNIFHLDSNVKVDLFMLGSSPFEQGQMRRRRRVRVGTAPDRFLYTYTPEDIVLQKLRWFRLGGSVSDRQWRDVISVLRTFGQPFDVNYLHEGAVAFAVTDLLSRALAEAADDQ